MTITERNSITTRQQEILDFIRDKIENRGFPPSIREIGEEFKIISPNGVMCHLKALERKGFIERNKGMKGKSAARAITIPGAKPMSVCFPMLGLVSAGPGLEMVAPNDEKIDLGDMFGGKDHYALKVRGQSMIEDHIDDGDVVILRKQDTADNGERVVAVVDGNATLKRIFRRKNQIVLEPSNATMEPIVVEPGRDVQVVGILVGVLRKC
jgi:repressor LexA